MFHCNGIRFNGISFQWAYRWCKEQHPKVTKKNLEQLLSRKRQTETNADGQHSSVDWIHIGGQDIHGFWRVKWRQLVHGMAKPLNKDDWRQGKGLATVATQRTNPTGWPNIHSMKPFHHCETFRQNMKNVWLSYHRTGQTDGQTECNA